MAKRKQLSVALSDKERAFLEQMAKQKDVSVAHLLRQGVKAVLKKECKAA